MKHFNLIITHEPGLPNYRKVLEIVSYAVSDHVLVDAQQSIVFLKVSDPLEAVKALSALAERSPILRMIPVDEVVEAYVEDVVEATKKHISRIAPGEKFRVTLEGKLYWRCSGRPARSVEAVNAIAEILDNPVDLENPDWILFVKTVKLYGVRRLAAVSVLRKEWIYRRARG